MKNTIFFIVLFFSVLSLKSQKVEKIWGEVLDYSTQNGILNADIQIVGNPLATKTDAKGNFSMFIESSSAKITLRITKEDYERYEVELSLPLTQLVEIRLKRIEKPKISIEGASIGTNIWGRVSGIAPNRIGQFKIIVYLFTDKYYIHPWAKSQKIISSNGEWRISSVRQPGPCPDKVLAAIVDLNYNQQAIIYGPDDKFLDWVEIDTSVIQCH